MELLHTTNQTYDAIDMIYPPPVANIVTAESAAHINSTLLSFRWI